MAPSRSSCNPTSLYRLDGGQHLADCLVSLDSATIDMNTAVELGPVTGRLVTGALTTDRPKWADHVQSLTGKQVLLPGDHPFAVLLVPLHPWTYALTWGSGHLLLDDELVEQGFGLMFGIRRLNAERLGLVASAALDASARTTQISYPGGTDLSGFRLEPYGELVTRMAGSADLAGLTYHADTARPYRIRVGNALWAPFAGDPHALLADLRAVGDVVDQPDHDSALRFVAQVRPLGPHHPRLPELRRRLAGALGGDERHGPLGIAWPSQAVNDAEQAGSFKVRGLGTFVAESLELEDFVARFAAVAEEQRLDVLSKARIVACLDQHGEESFGSLISAARWFVFETTIDHTRFCYLQGKWFKIGENYVGQIADQVADLLRRKAALTFPVWVPTGHQDDEHIYCSNVVAAQPGYLCLDKDFARTPFHPRFELCDILGPGNELVHVKWLGRAHAASHLFIQAQVSADAIRDEPEAMAELDAKVRALDPERALPSAPDTVVLAAAGRSWSVDTLFTLSQIALLRLDRSLHGRRMKLQFADIPYVPKRKAGRRAA